MKTLLESIWREKDLEKRTELLKENIEEALIKPSPLTGKPCIVMQENNEPRWFPKEFRDLTVGLDEGEKVGVALWQGEGKEYRYFARIEFLNNKATVLIDISSFTKILKSGSKVLYNGKQYYIDMDDFENTNCDMSDLNYYLLESYDAPCYSEMVLHSKVEEVIEDDIKKTLKQEELNDIAFSRTIEYSIKMNVLNKALEIMGVDINKIFFTPSKNDKHKYTVNVYRDDEKVLWDNLAEYLDKACMVYSDYKEVPSLYPSSVYYVDCYINKEVEEKLIKEA